MVKDKSSSFTNGAGFGRRLVAFLADGAIFYFFTLAVNSLLFGGGPLAMLSAQSLKQMDEIVKNMGQASSDPLAQLGQFLFLAMLIGYPILSWAFWGGATVGKKLMAVKIVDKDGSPVSLKKAVIRFFSYIPSLAVLLLGFLWIIWDKEKQGWHDKIAGTKVVKTDKKPKTLLTLLLPLAVVGFFIWFVWQTFQKSMKLARQEMWYQFSYLEAVEKMDPQAKEHWDKTQELFDQMRQKSDDPPEVIRLGKESIEELETALKIEPENPRLWAELGKAYSWIRTDEEKALQAYQKALAIEPKNVLYSNRLGDYFLRKKEYSRAVEQHLQSVKLQEDDGFAYYGLGLAYKGTGEIDKARESFNKAIDLFEEANSRGDYDKTIEEIKKELEGLDQATD